MRLAWVRRGDSGIAAWRRTVLLGALQETGVARPPGGAGRGMTGRRFLVRHRRTSAERWAVLLVDAGSALEAFVAADVMDEPFVTVTAVGSAYPCAYCGRDREVVTTWRMNAVVGEGVDWGRAQQSIACCVARGSPCDPRVAVRSVVVH